MSSLEENYAAQEDETYQKMFWIGTGKRIPRSRNKKV